MIEDNGGRDFVWGGWRKPYQYILEESIGTLGMVMGIRLHKCGQKHRMAIKGAIRDLESFGSKIDPVLFDAKLSLDHLVAALLLHESFIKNDPKMAAETENHFNKAFYAIRDFISHTKPSEVTLQPQYAAAVKVEKALVAMKNCTKTMRTESVEQADAVTEATMDMDRISRKIAEDLSSGKSGEFYYEKVNNPRRQGQSRGNKGSESQYALRVYKSGKGGEAVGWIIPTMGTKGKTIGYSFHYDDPHADGFKFYAFTYGSMKKALDALKNEFLGSTAKVTEAMRSVLKTAVKESVEVTEATMDMDRISRKIAEVVNTMAGNLSEDQPYMRAYSGRGMYGKYCLGVSVGRYEMNDLLKEFKRNRIPEPSKDALGMGAILYWQNIPHDPKIHINHHVKDESVDHGVDALAEAKRQPEATYFPSYTAALDAARAKAEREGYAIDENDWNTRVTHGYPGRPAEGETTNVKIGLSRVGKGGKPEAAVLVIAVYGMKQSFELTSYISKVPMLSARLRWDKTKRVGESVEVTEAAYNTIQVHPAYRDDDKGWYITHTDAKGGNQVWGPFASITEAKKAARKYAERYGATMKEESEGVQVDEAKDTGSKYEKGEQMEMGNFSKGNTKMQNGNISTRTMIDLVEAANRIDGSAAPLVEGLDAHLYVRGQHVYSGNTTHNHAQIAKAVDPSLYKALWESAGMPVTRLAPLLKTGIRELETNGDKYRHLDNKNNWGSVDHFLIFLRELYAACIQNPRAHYMGHS